MFFTAIARILAWLMILLGGFQIALVVSIINSETAVAMQSRYLGSKTTGETVDQAILVIVCGLIIGVLTDISRSIRNIE